MALNQKETALAAQMLRDYAEDLGNRSCNDWEFPADWTEEERREFVRAYHEWNGDPEEFDPEWLRLDDHCVASLLARKLST